MGNRATLLIFLLVLCHGVAMAMSYINVNEEEWEEVQRPDHWFLLRNMKQVIQTPAGQMRVVKSYFGRIVDHPMHIGFITMEPRTLFIPQYLDSSLILFIRRGEAKLGFIYKDDLVERRLKTGDVYRIPAGSAFYLVNVGQRQRLHIIASIDPSESLGVGVFQPFYIGGGTNPASVLAGFQPETLESAFNASGMEISRLFSGEQQGPIVFVDRPHAPSLWTNWLELKEEERLEHLRKLMDDQEQPEAEEEEEEEDQTSWSWRKLMESVFGNKSKKRQEKGTGKSPDSYNLYDRKPDFRNNYGWSVALDASDYSPLEGSDIGVYLVNLTAGAMMAPHVNPIATEYGIILGGYGRIEIVFPNGSSAMKAEIKEGDVFFVPRYFAFCQIASRTGPLEFFGFTTSARRNRPQFLVGATSLLRTMMGPELAASFGEKEETVRRVVEAQHESVILPTPRAAPGGGEPQRETENENNSKESLRIIKRIGNDMITGFDLD
ncbi:hypothetical protein L6164_021941 [Bauhinia variegata]|uniref:Uncharacterized protein n=1 Tax=Bauhinia variegata TaxID=167791 RepID=A0ACB9MEL5_BAUVA|nr:hypothetical protein L6164_021941 [Bauhinia variegata]